MRLHVEVLYVESSLRRRQDAPQHGPIRRGWLQERVNEASQDWREHLLGVEAEDLGGRMIPGTAQSYSDLAPGKGVVLLELQGHPEKALTSQIATEKGKSLAMEDVVEETRRAMKAMEDIAEETRRAMKAMEHAIGAQVDEARQEARAETARLADQVQKHETQILALRNENVELRKENVDLRTYMKRGLELGNKVKKRVALTLARVAVERSLGRKKEEDESWYAFFDGLSDAEWEEVGIVRRLVKNLLADGAYQFNESIHNIPPEEVVGSIAAMRLGSLRTAWEDIFYLAFNRRVTDEVFKAEVDYANDQERILGESQMKSSRRRWIMRTTKRGSWASRAKQVSAKQGSGARAEDL